jgi:hypothetical protein
MPVSSTTPMHGSPLMDMLAGARFKEVSDSRIDEINEKLDKLIDLLSPKKSAIITGPEVERIIEKLRCGT